LPFDVSRKKEVRTNRAEGKIQQTTTGGASLHMKRHIRIERTLRALKAVCCVLKTMMSQSLEESRTKPVRAMG
jgi:hypothetical protein